MPKTILICFIFISNVTQMIVNDIARCYCLHIGSTGAMSCRR